MQFKNRSNFIAFVYLVVLFLIINPAFASQKVVTGRAKSSSSSKPTVIVKNVTFTSLSKQLTYPARVIPEVNIPVLADIDGVVPRVFVHLGESVKKGAALLSLQHNEPGYEYKSMMLNAPISGVISLVDVNPGSPVTKGQKLVVITDPKRVYVEIEVAASDLSLVSTGLIGKLSLPTISSGQSIDVKISGISPLIDSATGTASCQLRAVKKEDFVYLKPGLVGQIVLDVNRHKGIEIPESALVYKDKDIFVRTIQNGKIKEIKVTTGDTRKGQIEILSGLKEKDVIAVRSSGFLTDGLDVTVEKESSNAP
jgi:multidrug efflux pump subunit AcrA (membrane-fusion protein)